METNTILTEKGNLKNPVRTGFKKQSMDALIGALANLGLEAAVTKNNTIGVQLPVDEVDVFAEISVTITTNDPMAKEKKVSKSTKKDAPAPTEVPELF